MYDGDLQQRKLTPTYRLVHGEALEARIAAMSEDDGSEFDGTDPLQAQFNTLDAKSNVMWS